MRTRKSFINSIVNILTYICLALLAFISRKIFLDNLGTDLAGLGSVLQNIIGFLSLAELGIGSAIIFSLYKPIADDNKVKVAGLICLYGKFYKIIGIIIILIGLGCLPFLDLIVNGSVSIAWTRVYFIIFLLNTSLTYWFSYRFCILYASQKAYIITTTDFIVKVIMNLVQIVVLINFQSYLLYLIVMCCSNLTYLILLNYLVSKKYKWLSNVKGEINKKDKTQIIKNIKALMLHKIGSFVVFSTPNIIISIFISLTAVAKFTNYYLVISTLQVLVNKGFDGMTASVGNLLLSNNKDKKYEIFNNLMFLNFWITSFLVISLFNTIDQFILIWIGKKYVLDNVTVLALLLNFYITAMRPSIERFKEAGGFFHQDRFAPLIEAMINLLFSITLVNIIGLPGVFIGALISNLSVVFWLKPKIVFNHIFERSVFEYFKKYFGYTFYMIIPLSITTLLIGQIKNNDSILYFIINCSINILIINGCYIIFFRKKREFIYFKGLIINKIKRPEKLKK